MIIGLPIASLELACLAYPLASEAVASYHLALASALAVRASCDLGLDEALEAGASAYRLALDAALAVVAYLGC
jgi:hypothetical protein